MIFLKRLYKAIGSHALLCLLSVFFISACAPLSLENRMLVASEITESVNMQQHIYSVRGFNIISWQKLHSSDNKTAMIYIEGDGLAWLTKNKPSSNPTPINPVALRLAAMDRSENVIYLARPCQYVLTPCSSKYWTGERFSPEVLKAYDQILSELKIRGKYTEFHLVGYSGGATVAALIAARRDDIVSFRSIAGNLDTHFFTHIHDVSSMPNSLNPIDEAQKLSKLPQIHFIGEDDQIIPSSISRRWLSRVGRKCLRIVSVPGVNHGSGWEDKWQVLQMSKPDCDIVVP